MNTDLKTIIVELIEEGENIRKVNYQKSNVGSDYINGPEYELWVTKCIDLIETHFKEHHLKDKLLVACNRAVGNRTKYYDEIVSVLKVLEDYVGPQNNLKKIINEDVLAIKLEQNAKCNKIFISHSSEDKDYVNQLIRLLNNIGVAKSNKNIFCSSFAGYNIPTGEKIYDYIKKEISSSTLVIFILSKNYYESVACLNEMGAAWIKAKNHISILVPSFETSRIKGVIDPTEICFKFNEKSRINSFRDDIVRLFDLPEINNNIWEKDRDEFLSSVNELVLRDKYSNSLTRVDVTRVKKISDNKISLDLRLINNGDIPVEFIELSIRLIDIEGNECVINISDIDLKKFIIYGSENRREVLTLDLPQTNYNPSRHKGWHTKSNSMPMF